MCSVVVTTGGAGFIGSHVTAALLEAGNSVVIVDNFQNADRDVPDHIEGIGNGSPVVVEADCRDASAMEKLFSSNEVDAVIHLAGLKSASDSVRDPLSYYGSNLSGAVVVFDAAVRHGVSHFVFSSSAAVYGIAERVPTDESVTPHPANPYGRTKLVIEHMLEDLSVARPTISAISLRYFNPVGCHPSRLIGDPINSGTPNLLTYTARAAAGMQDAVDIYGTDYDTPDGTGVRDYIHVVDLAAGHLAALEALRAGHYRGRHAAINLGTGRGYSVREVLDAFSQACGHDVPYRTSARRPGDIAQSIADPGRAEAELRWEAQWGLGRMCADHWAYFEAALKRKASPSEEASRETASKDDVASAF
jgi:UDP-glucose 4-epimerase